MLQLILTIVAIALTAAFLAASVNYIPWWYKSAADTEEVIRKSLPLLEQAYDVATRADNGTVPAVRDDLADGGFQSIFQPILKLTPAAPGNFRWKYGLNEANGLNWVCLENVESGGASEGAWRGVSRARSVYSEQQFVVSDSCGAVTNVALPTSYPTSLAVTFYLAYTPGVTR